MVYSGRPLHFERPAKQLIEDNKMIEHNMTTLHSPSLHSVEAGAPAEMIDVTETMIDAGFEALLESCVAEHICEGDRFVIRDIFNAMICLSSLKPAK
jgi:hypothetical protein